MTALPRYPAWRLGLVLLAQACRQLGDARLAMRLDGLLEPYADRILATGRFGAFYYASAAALAGRMQSRPMVAMSQVGQARALLALTGPGDRQQAAALLAEAVACAGNSVPATEPQRDQELAERGTSLIVADRAPGLTMAPTMLAAYRRYLAR